MLIQGNACYSSKLGTVTLIDGLAQRHSLINMLKLHQTKCGIDFAHFAVNPRCSHRQFVSYTEVFQAIDALFGFGILADNRTAFKGIEYLGGVKA